MVPAVSHQSSWTTPPEGFIKINVDGAVGHTGIASSTIVRDHVDHFQGCITHCSVSTLLFEAKAIVFALGVELAATLNIQHCIIEGDAQSIITYIEGDVSPQFHGEFDQSFWWFTTTPPVCCSFEK
ncbi:hypothetical protein BVC80_1157g19 [Macleaya cordata]|uniref:RNase H type-1 domain-containing protein n=1 Tax=Macleaya cordata TaxID=56857 RepID=A0A200QR97_MACCD|nr:hypothetical protein BVC80_1157g19 [Macleaya cordata]